MGEPAAVLARGMLTASEEALAQAARQAAVIGPLAALPRVGSDLVEGAAHHSPPLASHAGEAGLARVQDQWVTRVPGHGGDSSVRSISQPWLRIAKRPAAGSNAKS